MRTGRMTEPGERPANRIVRKKTGRRLWTGRLTMGIGIFLSFALFAEGCGAIPGISGKMVDEDTLREEEAREEEIELIDPEDPPEGWERAEYRNFYDATVYKGAVYPYTEEYSFTVDTTLDEFRLYPGESVKKGDVLAVGNLEEIDASIEKMEEQIQAMEEEYEEYKTELEESLAEPEEEAERLKEIVEIYKKAEPPMNETVSSGDAFGAPGQEGGGSQGGAGGASGQEGGGSQGGAGGAPGQGENGSQGGAGGAPGQEGGGSQEGAFGASGQEGGGSQGDAGGAGGTEPEYTQEYRNWLKEYTDYEGQYRILDHQNNVKRLQLQNRTELYELDHAHLIQQLDNLKEERQKYILVSGMSGEVAAINMEGSGSRVSKAQAVVAVGDSSRKLIKCEYINSKAIGGAKEVYALINGARHEVTYQAYSGAEYSALVSRGETAVSTFTLEDDADVSVGDYAVIVLVRESRESALSIPDGAIHSDSSGHYVYLRKGEGNEVVPVTTGVSDGVYTEITSGLKEGDQVAAADPVAAGTERTVLEKGAYSDYFNGNGTFFYPVVYDIENPVTYGTACFVEYQVEPFQYVEKGDVIASIHVKGDDIALARNQLSLTRQKERLDERIAGGEEIDPGELEKLKEPITKLEELIADMKKDYAVTRILAPESGIVTSLAEHGAEDILPGQAVLGQIADVRTCYVVVEHRDLLNYGNQVLVHYKDSEGEEKQTEGKVVSLSGYGIGKDLRSSYSVISVPPQAAVEMIAGGLNSWNRQGTFRVEAEARKMENVVLVPVDAVNTAHTIPYVKTIGADGEAVARTFISGANDRNFYWVVDGLTEGMELCLE